LDFAYVRTFGLGNGLSLYLWCAPGDLPVMAYAQGTDGAGVQTLALTMLTKPGAPTVRGWSVFPPTPLMRVEIGGICGHPVG
jgi:hypothetical protein